MGDKINNYTVSDVNLTAMMETIDAQRQGFMKVSITNYDNDSEPEIAAGSMIEVNGALYEFDVDEEIGGSPSDGDVFIKIIPSGVTCSAEFTNTEPEWDDEKGGWYEPLTNNRYLHFIMYKSGSSYLRKNDIFMPTGAILPWHATTAPWGYLLCDGATYNATTYAKYLRLYHIIKNAYGGSDQTDFKVPDLRGRTLLGLDNMGGSSVNRVTSAQADSIGGAAGNEGIPYHRHEYTKTNSGAGSMFEGASPDAGVQAVDYTEYAGDVASENNMPPYLAVAWIIRFL